jgi:GAG-pre-integrase domain
VEDLGYSLISVGKLADKGLTSIFRAEAVELNIEPKKLILGSGIRDRDDSSLYVLPSPRQHEHTLVSVDNKEGIGTWHKRMAHINLHELRLARKYSDVPKNIDVVDDGVCFPCREGKATTLLFRGRFEYADEVGDIIHCDMGGKLPIASYFFPGRYQYITTLTDDYFRYISVALCSARASYPNLLRFSVVNIKFLQKESLRRGRFIHRIMMILKLKIQVFA